MTGFVEVRSMTSLFGRETSLLGHAAFPASGLGNCLHHITQVSNRTHDFSANRVPSRRRTGKIPAFGRKWDQQPIAPKAP
jgi:hypothetical protein